MSRNNAPATYVTTGRDADGNLWFQQISNETPFGEPSESNSGNKNIYMEGALNYDRMFGRHTVSGMGLFYQKERQLHNEALAYRKQAYIGRSEENTSELQSLMRTSYAVFWLKKKNKKTTNKNSDIKTQI